MRPLTVNRADFYWTLDAAIPHMGSKSQGLDYVGIEWDSLTPELDVYATDSYTVGMSTIKVTWDHPDAGPIQDIGIPKKEVKDLLQFVRPEVVAQRDTDVNLLVADGELHVGLLDRNSEPLSEVYGLVIPPLLFSEVYGLIVKVRNAPHDTTHPALPFNPDFAARFAKAKREETDRLLLYPRATDNTFGASYITVGDNFEGAIAGLSWETPVQEQEAA